MSEEPNGAPVPLSDRVRYLSQSGFPSYTLNRSKAMRGEAEPLDDDALEIVAAESRDRALRSWGVSRRRLLSEIEHVRQHVRLPHVDRACRSLEREVASLDKRLI